MHVTDNSSTPFMRTSRNGLAPTDSARNLLPLNAHMPPASTVYHEPGDPQPMPKRRRSSPRLDTSPVSETQLDSKRLKRLRGRRGSLQSLPEMPLDILFEIFALLSPMDLLHIARTTKLLRNTIMNRSSRWIWTCALASIEGFPECPSEMSEPEYVNLAFNTHCHFCLKGNSNIIVWADHKRSCKTCFPNNYLSNLSNMGLDVPLAHLVDILPFINRPPGFAGVSGRYFSLHTARIYSNQYSHLSNESERREWIDKKLQEGKLRRAHAQLCDAWFQNRHAQRLLERRAVRSRRLNAIVAKLTELGWDGRFDVYMLRQHKLVNQPKDLTERAWSRIKDPIISFLWEQRRPKVIKERREMLSAILASYVTTQHPRAMVPNIADLLEMESFRTLIEDTPDEGGSATDLFKGTVTEFPMLVDNWRQARKNELVDLMKVERPDAVDAMLLLATTFYCCAACESVVEYSRILGHSCLTCRGGSSLHVELGSTPWNYGDLLTFHRGAFRVADSILRACCIDPETVTSEGLQLADPLIECLTCTHLGQDRVFMTWSQAVIHVRSHPGLRDVLDQPGKFNLHNCVAAIVEVRESSNPSTLEIFEREGSFFLCVQCKRKESQADMRIHIQSRHAISEPIESRDYITVVWLRVNQLEAVNGVSRSAPRHGYLKPFVINASMPKILVILKQGTGTILLPPIVNQICNVQ